MIILNDALTLIQNVITLRLHNFFVLSGCGILYVADGNWKLKYAHCMWHVPVFVDGFAKPINYPSICPLSPERGKAFCAQHCSDACNGGIPTGLHEFLQFCGVKGRNGESGNFPNMTLQRFQSCQPQKGGFRRSHERHRRWLLAGSEGMLPGKNFKMCL